MFRSRLVLAFVAAECSASATLAQLSLTTAFTYQGVLKQGGSPANGVYDMRFRLYDALVGGMLQSANQCFDNVTVIDGLFTVTLDFGGLGGQRRFLNIEVRPDTGFDCLNSTGLVALSPRQELTAAPYALYALNVNGSAVTNLNANNITNGSLVPTHMPASGNWNPTGPINIDSNTMYIDPTNNRIGMGTSAPLHPLHVLTANQSAARFENSSQVPMVVEFRNAASSTTWDQGVNGTITPFQGPPGSLFWQKQGNASPAMVITPDHSVGIGTNAPLGKLHVGSGDLLAGAGGQEWIFHTRSHAGSDFLQITDYDAGVPQFQRGLTLHQNGNVGVGKTNPSAKLDVAGNIAATSISVASVLRTHTIHGYDLRVRTGDMAGVLYDDTGVRFFNPSTPKDFVASVQLPDGATITALEMWGRDAFASADMICRLGRTNFSGGTAEMASVVSNLGGSVWQTTSISFPAVDNDTHAYWLRVTLQGAAPPDFEHKVYAVKIIYSITQPLP